MSNKNNIFDLITALPVWNGKAYHDLRLLIWCDKYDFEIILQLSIFLDLHYNNVNLVIMVQPYHQNLLVKTLAQLNINNPPRIERYTDPNIEDIFKHAQFTHQIGTSGFKYIPIHKPLLAYDAQKIEHSRSKFGAWRNRILIGVAYMKENEYGDKIATDAVLNRDSWVKIINNHAEYAFCHMDYGIDARKLKLEGFFKFVSASDPYEYADIAASFAMIPDIIICADNIYALIAIALGKYAIIIADKRYDLYNKIQSDKLTIISANQPYDDIIDIIGQKIDQYITSALADEEHKNQQFAEKYINQTIDIKRQAADYATENYMMMAAKTLLDSIDESQREYKDWKKLTSVSTKLANFANVCDYLIAQQRFLPLIDNQYLILAHAYFSLKKYNKALETLIDYYGSERPDIQTMPISELHNLASCLCQVGKTKLAQEYFLHILTKEPDHAAAQQALAHNYLLEYNFDMGWPAFEHRWKSSSAKDLGFRPRIDAPWWEHEENQPQDISDKHILIWREQGLGDELMFSSLIPYVIKHAKHVTISCEHRLISLFARSFPTADIIDHNLAVTTMRDGVYDVQLPMGSLPYILDFQRSFKPKPKPHLKIDQKLKQKYRKKLQQHANSKILIGLSWFSKSGSFDQISTIPLEYWSPIWKMKHVQFVNIQYGPTAKDLDYAAQQAGIDIIHWDSPDTIADMDEFTCLIGALDGVITISNTTVHQAGGLGLPCFVMLSQIPQWRYGLKHDKNYWYRDNNLIRQKSSDTSWLDLTKRTARTAQHWVNNNIKLKID